LDFDLVGIMVHFEFLSLKNFVSLTTLSGLYRGHGEKKVLRAGLKKVKKPV